MAVNDQPMGRSLLKRAQTPRKDQRSGILKLIIIFGGLSALNIQFCADVYTIVDNLRANIGVPAWVVYADMDSAMASVPAI